MFLKSFDSKFDIICETLRCLSGGGGGNIYRYQCNTPILSRQQAVQLWGLSQIPQMVDLFFFSDAAVYCCLCILKSLALRET